MWLGTVNRDGAGDEGRQGPDQVRHCRPRQGSWGFYKKGNGAWAIAQMCFGGESLDWMVLTLAAHQHYLETQSWDVMVYVSSKILFKVPT